MRLPEIPDRLPQCPACPIHSRPGILQNLLKRFDSLERLHRIGYLPVGIEAGMRLDDGRARFVGSFGRRDHAGERIQGGLDCGNIPALLGGFVNRVCTLAMNPSAFASSLPSRP